MAAASEIWCCQSFPQLPGKDEIEIIQEAIMQKRFLTSIVFVIIFACGPIQADEINLALGKKYTCSLTPNYSLTLDAEDNTQLTDGVFSSTDKPMWFHKTSVGWNKRNFYHSVTVDLEKVEPIKSIKVNVGGWQAQSVYFPSMIFFVSDDYQNFYPVGSRYESQISDDNKAKTVLVTLDTPSKGRFVTIFFIGRGYYVFLDEIEVFKGDFPVSGIKFAQSPVKIENLKDTVRAIRKADERVIYLKSTLDKIRQTAISEKVDLLAEIDDLNSKLQPFGMDFSTVELLEQQVAVLNGKLASLLNPKNNVIIYGRNAWNNFDLFALPPKSTEDVRQINLVMGSNEYESASIILFNGTPQNENLKVEVSNLKSNNNVIASKDIVIRYSEWSECFDQIKWYPDALVLYQDKLPLIAGNNRSVYLTIKTNNTPQGDYQGTITISNENIKKQIALKVAVLPVALPDAMPLASYNWSYSGQAPIKADVASALTDLKLHYIDTAMVGNDDIPKFTLDPSGNIISSDYTNFKKYIQLYQGFGIHKFIFFMGFANINHKQIVQPLGYFSGGPIKFNTPAWHNAMSNIITDWMKVIKELNLSYDDFALYPLDEPNKELIGGGDAGIVFGTLKKLAPQAKIYVTTTGISLNGLQTLSPYVSIWCDHLDKKTPMTSEKMAFFDNERKSGKQLYLYNCLEPDKSFAPLGHYRKMLWQAWQYQASGIGFWAYADTGRNDGLSAWTDYDGILHDYSIIYDAQSAPAQVSRKEAQIPSRRWEAWRDGVEDYAYLFMLKNAITKAGQSGKDSQVLANARSILDNSVKNVLDNPDNIDVYNNAKMSILRAIIELNK